MASKSRRAHRRTWGSVTEVRRGKKYVVRWTEGTPEGRKRRSKTVHGTYRDALNLLAQLQVEHADDRPSPTFEQAYNMWYRPWLERTWPSAKETARSAHERAWRNQCVKKWGVVPVDQVKPLDVQRWLNGMGKNQAVAAMQVMRKIGDFCVRYECADSNRFRERYEMPTESGSHDKSVLTLEQANCVFGQLRGSPVEAPFILACFGSCRTAESVGVKVSEMQPFESSGVRMALVDIVRQMPRTGTEPMPDGKLKTKESVRTIAVPEPYGTRLLEIAAERVADGSEWLADRGIGEPMNHSVLNWMWKNSGVTPYVPFQNLRTSWRTFAEFDWKIAPTTLELLMGHRIPGVTGEHYLRPTREAIACRFASEFAPNLQR